MQDPEEYVKATNPHPEIIHELMASTYGKFMRKKGNVTLLDIGCGPGNNTGETLKPYLPPQSKIVGIDVEEKMISYAKKTYPDVEFFVLDIETKNLPGKFLNSFDYAFSSFCLHWVTDQRCAMNNIYRMLKPDGYMLCHYLGACPFFDMYYKTSQMQRWKNYITDVNKYLSPFGDKEAIDIENTMRNILNEVGFKVHICKVEERKFPFFTMKELRDLIASIHPQISKIPKDLKDEFMDDNINELVKKNIIKLDDKEYIIRTNFITLVAEKIEHRR